jgi:hypothetical protein
LTIERARRPSRALSKGAQQNSAYHSAIVPRELTDAGNRLVDVVLAKHLLAYLEAFREQRAVARDQSSSNG